MQTLFKNFGAGVTIGLLGLWTQVPNHLHAEGLFGPTENATLTEYDGDQVIARVHADRVFMDHEKWGFFRVGLLPLAVVQGVQVQILSDSFLTNALSDLNSLNLASANLRHLEFRDLQISLLGEIEPRLRAATARLNPSGALELFRVSLTSCTGEPVSRAKATLQISGAAAGRLRWQDGGKEIELLVLKPPQKLKPETKIP